MTSGFSFLTIAISNNGSEMAVIRNLFFCITLLWMKVKTFDSKRLVAGFCILISFRSTILAVDEPVISTDLTPTEFRAPLSRRAAIPAPPAVVVAMWTIFTKVLHSHSSIWAWLILQRQNLSFNNHRCLSLMHRHPDCAV